MNKPEYKNRAKPATHTSESLDRSKLSKFVLKLLDDLESLPIIPPKNGDSYSSNKVRYNLEDESSVRLSERQLNLAQVSSEGYDKAKFEMFVEAGYSPYAIFDKPGNYNNVKQIKQELTSKYDLYCTEDIQKMTNHIRYNNAVEISIDAKWLLAEQIDLYGECRRKHMYTQAVRLLHDISYHVDVDARVSNKIEIEGKVDYAAILQAADNRLTLPEDTKSLPHTEDTDVVEGEYEVM